MDSQMVGRRCYIESDLIQTIQSLKLNLTPRIIFEIIQKLQTEVTWIEVTKTGK